MKRLQGKVILITGAGRGIGKGIARRLAMDGANIAVNDINEEAAFQVSKSIKNMGRESIPLVADVSNVTHVTEMFKQLLQIWDRLDVCIINAAICPGGPVIEQEEASWDRAFDVNVKGAFLCAKAAARQMTEQRSGRILISSSGAGLVGIKYLACYSATKAALIAFAQALSRELGPYGVLVNAYSPGFTPSTEMQKDLDRKLAKYTGLQEGEMAKTFVRKIPLGRPGTPEDVAGLVSFLCSSDASYITGQMILADGGIGAVSEMT